MTSLTSGVSRRCLMSAALASSRSMTAMTAVSMSTSVGRRQREEPHSPPSSSPSSSLRPPSCQMDNLMGERMQSYLCICFKSRKVEKRTFEGPTYYVYYINHERVYRTMPSPQTSAAALSLTRTVTVSVNLCASSCATSWRRCSQSLRRTASPPRRFGGGSGNRFVVVIPQV